MKYLPYIIAMACLLACQSSSNDTFVNTSQKSKELVVGAASFNEYLPMLKGKKVAAVVNQTSRVGATHLVDTLLSLGIEFEKIFAPEHGFRGNADAGQHLTNSIDNKTGLPIISLYGKHRKPSIEDLKDIDVVLFDIQDVGVRFYTYISTMHYVMEACAETKTMFLLLDRPNPNGNYIGGPVLDLKYQSFVGMHPIPIVHGLTVGELATMINGEHWLENKLICDLKVIKVKNYTHQTPYRLPIKPSPNLPNQRSILLYPSLCLFEPTQMSIGRGTSFPFQVIGYPDSSFGKFRFTPVSTPGAATHPKYQDQTCYGVDLRNTPDSVGFTLKWLVEFYRKNPNDTFITSTSFFDKLAGNETLRSQLLQGLSAKEIEASWQPDLEKYSTLRAKYLLYPD